MVSQTRSQPFTMPPQASRSIPQKSKTGQYRSPMGRSTPERSDTNPDRYPGDTEALLKHYREMVEYRRSLPPPKPFAINSFPDELIEGVFLHFVYGSYSKPTDYSNKGPSQLTRISTQSHINPNTPLLLGRVSSRWRSIANSSPILWAKISVFDPFPGQIQLFKLWIERAQSCTLDFHLWQGFNTEPNRQIAFLTFVKTALAESRRITDLQLTFMGEGKGITDSLWRKLDFPKLRAFELQCSSWSESNCRSFYQRLCTSPVLEDITMPSWSIEPTWVTGINWQNIKSIDLNGDMTTTGLLDLLSSTPLMEYCMFQSLLPSEEYSGPVLALPNLHSFHVRSVLQYPEALAFLSLPSLTDFSLGLRSNMNSKFDPSEGKDTWSLIIKLGQNSPTCRLKVFKLMGSWDLPIVDIGAAKALVTPMFSTVTELYLDALVGNKTLQALTWKSRFDRPMPLLASLHLRSVVSTDGLLSEMLLSRTKGVPYSERTLRDAYASLGLTFAPGEDRKDMRLRIPEIKLQLMSFKNTKY